MKKNRKAFLSAGILLISAVMILLFPRENNIAIATAFAILFWLSFLAYVWQTVAVIRRNHDNRRKQMQAKSETKRAETVRIEKSSGISQDKGGTKQCEN